MNENTATAIAVVAFCIMTAAICMGMMFFAAVLKHGWPA